MISLGPCGPAASYCGTSLVVHVGKSTISFPGIRGLGDYVSAGDPSAGDTARLGLGQNPSLISAARARARLRSSQAVWEVSEVNVGCGK